MPFGLINAPVTFQRLMNRLFTGEEWKSVFVYLDDILVVSPTCEEHLRDVSRVLDRLGEAGVRLKPAKCCFARSEVESSVKKDQTVVTTTKRGREVRKPARFMTISDDSQGRLSLKGGGSCKDQTGRESRGVSLYAEIL